MIGWIQTDGFHILLGYYGLQYVLICSEAGQVGPVFKNAFNPTCEVVICVLQFNNEFNLYTYN